MQKASLRKGDYLLFSLVILLQLQHSPHKTGELTISSLLPFCSTTEALFCSSTMLLHPFENRETTHLVACSCIFYMLKTIRELFLAFPHLLLKLCLLRAQVHIGRSKACPDSLITQQMEDTCPAQQLRSNEEKQDLFQLAYTVTKRLMMSPGVAGKDGNQNIRAPWRNNTKTQFPLKPYKPNQTKPKNLCKLELNWSPDFFQASQTEKWCHISCRTDCFVSFHLRFVTALNERKTINARASPLRQTFSPQNKWKE